MMRTHLFRLRLTLQAAFLCSLLAPAASAVVTIDWVIVGDPGNACETQSQGCFGAVADEYKIGEFEVDYTQYVEFLNAVATSDPNGLYNTGMGSSSGGITRTGDDGSYSYTLIAGRENMPVSRVSLYDAMRFANWLHNGQPAGAQDNTTTEDGAYTITSEGIAANSITRNSGASVFVPSGDEWYKAAYYDTNSMSYFDYPASSDNQTACTTPGSSANTANCQNPVGDVTEVGSYTGSASPNGTFDQGGNLWEWDEEILTGAARELRGGGYINNPGFLAASIFNFQAGTGESRDIGFRVASLGAAPAVPSMNPIGIALLSSLLGLVSWRKIRAQRYA